MSIKSILTDVKARLDGLLTFANNTTGASDVSLGDAVLTLVNGYGGGGGDPILDMFPYSFDITLSFGADITMTFDWSEVTQNGSTIYNWGRFIMFIGVSNTKDWVMTSNSKVIKRGGVNVYNAVPINLQNSFLVDYGDRTYISTGQDNIANLCSSSNGYNLADKTSFLRMVFKTEDELAPTLAECQPILDGTVSFHCRSMIPVAITYNN